MTQGAGQVPGARISWKALRPGSGGRGGVREVDDVAGRVFITRPIPESGPSLLAEVADQVEVSPHDRPLSSEELRRAVAGRDAVICLLTDWVDVAVLEAARGCRLFANIAVGDNNVEVT